MTLAMKSEETRRRILNASVRIFAELGYEAATIRQITDKAEANISSVNYHFGDKLNLYREVIKDGFGELHQILKARCSTGDPHERLRAYLEEMIKIAADDERTWHRIIITRELFPQGRQSQVLDYLAELIRPIHSILVSIVKDLLALDGNVRDAEIAAEFVTGVISHWIHKRDLIQIISPEIGIEALKGDTVQELLYQFTIGGLDRLKRALGQPEVVAAVAD